MSAASITFDQRSLAALISHHRHHERARAVEIFGDGLAERGIDHQQAAGCFTAMEAMVCFHGSPSKDATPFQIARSRTSCTSTQSSTSRAFRSVRATSFASGTTMGGNATHVDRDEAVAHQTS